MPRAFDDDEAATRLVPKRAFDADEAATRLVDEVLAGRELRPATRPPAAGWTLHLEPVTSTYFYHDASTGASAVSVRCTATRHVATCPVESVAVTVRANRPLIRAAGSESSDCGRRQEMERGGQESTHKT